MTPLRVGYVLNVFPKLSETFIASELAGLQKRGVELCILSLRTPTESLRHPLIDHSGLARRAEYDSARFFQTLVDFRPNLLHAHFATEPAAAARDFSAELGVPFTFTAHGYDIHRKAPLDFRQRALAAEALITVSDSNARFIETHFGVPKAHIHVIPCGVDTEMFQPAKHGSDNDPPIILCVARHVLVKNLSLLLRAFALLKERKTLFRGVLVGDGPCRPVLEQLCKELGLENETRFIGPATQAEVLGWLQRARAVALTSQNEGMPVSLMEAAACAVPVAATAVGGVPELVQDQQTGFLVPPDDAEALATALQCLIENKPLAVRMGNAGREWITRSFSLERQLDRLLSLWEGVIP